MQKNRIVSFIKLLLGQPHLVFNLMTKMTDHLNSLWILDIEEYGIFKCPIKVYAKQTSWLLKTPEQNLRACKDILNVFDSHFP